MPLTNAQKQAAWRIRRDEREARAADLTKRQAIELAEARAEIAELKRQILALAKHIADLTAAP